VRQNGGVLVTVVFATAAAARGVPRMFAVLRILGNKQQGKQAARETSSNAHLQRLQRSSAAVIETNKSSCWVEFQNLGDPSWVEFQNIKKIPSSRHWGSQ
jgi:hypothetical protein